MNQKIRIKLKSFDHSLVDKSSEKIVRAVKATGAIVSGPIPLPTEIKKYTVNRSAFVYKDAREQFEMRIHRRLIDIINPNAKVIEALTNISLPSGVNIDVKMI
jgi:small subunit ribosomal protein S10